MSHFEYIVVPAPRKGVSSKGVKGVPGKFANALTILMNEMAIEGWDYLRTDTLPCEERQGLTGKAVKYHAMLVFRRMVELEDEEGEVPLALAAPDEGEQAEDPFHEEEDDAEPEEEDTSEPSDDEEPEEEEKA
jgi:hypothetical protein